MTRRRVTYRYRVDMIVEYANDSTALLVQQNNCVTLYANPASLSGSMAEKIPHADPYEARRMVDASPTSKNLASPAHRAEPGTIAVYSSKEKRTATVACLFAQFKPGKTDSTYFLNTDDEHYRRGATLDTERARVGYFAACLIRLVDFMFDLARAENIKIVVFPFMIGCGRGGGCWSNYRRLIEAFADKLSEGRPDVEVHVLKL